MAARAGAGGEGGGGARADGGGRARRPDECVLRRAVRCAPGDDDHRERAGYSGGEHADRRAGGHVRAGAALPDPRAGGALEAAGLCLLHDRAEEEADAAGGEAAAGAGEPRQSRGGVQSGEPGSRYSRGGEHPRRGAVGAGARGGLRALPGDAAGDDREDPVGRGRDRRATGSGRRRSISGCRC